ncbi:unnamed protein product [Echinostoma caproni]|uniref:Uncharacterized protein n=1 Tax=Echinostoma caproni TaxID=27848 RepID=A0A3P8L969_9TREM|nr:unnamed protein product [Echinostoma caproni]
MGLGDIVVPGIFIAMLLRFDVSLQRKDSKLYFYTGYIAYVVGLATTFIVMHVFKAAQSSQGSNLCDMHIHMLEYEVLIQLCYEDVPEHNETTQDSSTKPAKTTTVNKIPSSASGSANTDRKKKVN